MNRTILALIAVLTLAGCSTWSQLSPDQKSGIVAQGLRTIVKPECVRLDQLKGLDDNMEALVVSLCQEAVEDTIVAVQGGLTQDASVVCPVIAEKAKRCSDLIKENDADRQAQDVATCERVINAASLACTVALTKPTKPELLPPVSPQS